MSKNLQRHPAYWIARLWLEHLGGPPLKKVYPGSPSLNHARRLLRRYYGVWTTEETFRVAALDAGFRVTETSPGFERIGMSRRWAGWIDEVCRQRYAGQWPKPGQPEEIHPHHRAWAWASERE